jgi:hypothetical protein
MKNDQNALQNKKEHAARNPWADPNALVSTEEAAEFLNLTPFTLRRWRMGGRAELPYVALSKTRVKYRVGDLLAFVESRRVGA